MAKMGRPKVNTRTVSIRLEESVIERLREIATERGTTVPSLVTMTMVSLLKRNEELEELKKVGGGRGEPVPPVEANPRKTRKKEGAPEVEKTIEKPKKATPQSRPSNPSTFKCTGWFCDWKGTKEEAATHPRKGLLCPECGDRVVEVEAGEKKAEPKRKGVLDTIL